MSRHSPQRHNATEPELIHRPWLGLVLAAIVGAGLILAVTSIPRETARLPAIARQALLEALRTGQRDRLRDSSDGHFR